MIIVGIVSFIVGVGVGIAGTFIWAMSEATVMPNHCENWEDDMR